jgi:hypothetical protein
MQTIIDAVNELRGDLNNAPFAHPDSEYIGYLKGHTPSLLMLSPWKNELTICTIDEYITETMLMSLNYGKCSIMERALYTGADKELLTKEIDTDIDWSKYEISYLMKNKPEPTYTQEMCDNGDFPAIGMECAFETTFFTHLPSNTGTGKPIAYHDNKVWFSTGSKEFVINLNVIYFKPLTPRIDLIDGKAYQFDCDEGKLHGIYDHALEWFVTKELRVFIDEATNIQLLTVGDK